MASEKKNDGPYLFYVYAGVLPGGMRKDQYILVGTIDDVIDVVSGQMDDIDAIICGEKIKVYVVTLDTTADGRVKKNIVTEESEDKKIDERKWKQIDHIDISKNITIIDPDGKEYSQNENGDYNFDEKWDEIWRNKWPRERLVYCKDRHSIINRISQIIL